MHENYDHMSVLLNYISELIQTFALLFKEYEYHLDFFALIKVRKRCI